MRTYDDLVEVRGAPAGPRQFLWRGRLYVVRAVLSHWYERAAWWDGAAAQVLRGQDGDAGSGSLDAAGGEREVWRVEASAGRAAGTGVFDLAATSGPEREAAAWRLVRVMD